MSECPPPGIGQYPEGYKHPTADPSDDEDLPVIRISDPQRYDPNPWPVTFMALGALAITGAAVAASGKRG